VKCITGGRDIFDYGFKNAGNDAITDFTLGNTTTRSSADTINLSDLLIGYSGVYQILSGSGIGVVCDTPSNIISDSALTSSEMIS
jgi:hypothetical protein